MNIKVIKSNRKSISIEITKDLSLIVRAPIFMSDDEIYAFADSKKKWIDKHLNKIKEQNKARKDMPKLSQDEISSLADRACELIPQRAAYFAPIIGVDYGRITIRNQVSRWGSCSSKGNLNFNCLLMLTPPEVIDYVVVHELCHRKEMNHSPKFWDEVKRILPNFDEQRRWLKENGSALIERMR